MSDNEKYINILKNKVNVTTQTMLLPNLNSIFIRNNYIVISQNDDMTIHPLGRLNLNYLDVTLFYLKDTDIFFIVSNISDMVNDPDKLKSRVNNINNLLLKNVLSSEEFDYIKKYMLDFFRRSLLSRTYSYPGCSDDILLMTEPITKSYDEVNNMIYENPAASFIRELDSNNILNNTANEQNQSKKKDKSKVLTNKNFKGSKLTDNHNGIDGFMSITAIISVTIILGLIIAFTLFAIK